MRSRKYLVCVSLLLALAGLAVAADRLEFPGDFPGPPIYADYVEEFHTSTWAMIPFWREPEGIPADFNLLDIFDAPAALSVPLTIEGFVIRDAPLPAPPTMIQIWGKPEMPIWLVAPAELEAGVADGALTIGELRGMPSLQKGTATYYHERIQPPETAHLIEARGTLPDGRTFEGRFAHGFSFLENIVVEITVE
jgi:hypothetical protein